MYFLGKIGKNILSSRFFGGGHVRDWFNWYIIQSKIFMGYIKWKVFLSTHLKQRKQVFSPRPLFLIRDTRCDFIIYSDMDN